MKAILSLVLVIATFLSASGAAIVWTNTVGGAWQTAENWSPNQVPTGGDDVIITNAGTYVVAIHIAAAARSVVLGGSSGVQALNMPGAPLVVSNTFTIASSGLLQALGTLNVFGDVVVNGEFQALSLVLGGSGALDVAGGRLRLLSHLRISHRTVRNSGTVICSDGGQLFLGDNAWFTNFASGTLVFTNDNTGIEYDGSFLNTNQFVANHGLIRAHGNSFIAVPSVHSGTIEVLAGQLSLRRYPSYTSFPIDVTATCHIAAGATLAFENASTEFRPPASASGAGHLRVVGGNLNLTGAYSLTGTLICQNNAVVHLNTGSPFTLPHLVNEGQADVRGPDPLTITGTLLWRNGGKFSGPAPLTLAATAQTTFELSITAFTRPWLANAGTMTWHSADLQLDVNSVFTNLPTGVIVITNAPSLQNTFVTSVGIRENQAFHNAGTIRSTSDSATELSIPFFNTGMLRIERNQFRMTFNATFAQHSGATELAGGTLRFFPGSNYRLHGGALIGQGSVLGDDVENLGGTISPGTSPGQINFNQSLSLNPAGALNIELGGTNTGTGFDQVTVVNTADLGGGVLNVALANNFTPTVGMKFAFLTCGSRSGTFQSFSYPSNQLALQLNYLPNGVELEVLQVASALQISPSNVTLDSGEARTFSASGGTPPYSFAVIQNQSGGTIQPSTGFYTAGPNGGIDLVRVTDAASATAQASVIVIPFDLIISDTTPQDFLNLLTHIEGSVVMSNIDARATLLVPGLASIGHDLIVRDNDQLVTLNLGALQTVGGTIDISGNPALTNIALPALTNATGNVVVSDNDSMTSLDLDSLTTANGDVIVYDNDSMTSLDLAGLESAGGVVVDDNDSMTSLNLDSLITANGDVIVTDNDLMTSLDLASLESAAGVVVDDNDAMTSLNLDSLITANGDVIVTDNDSMTSLDLTSLQSASGDVIVFTNTSASSVSLGSLTSAGGSVDVSGNTSATNINLPALAFAGGDVDVSGNTAAVNIDVGALVQTGGKVDVSGNTSATGIDLSSLSSTGGSVDVSGNTSARGVDLRSLMSTGGSVDVSGNTNASGINLTNLTTTGGAVKVSGNTSASGVDLESLTSVGGDVTVVANTSASSVSFGSLTNVDGNVSVANNTAASSIDLSALSVVSGTVSVSSNTAASSIDLSSLTVVDGNVSVANNTAASSIDLSALSVVSGTVSISSNTAASSIDLSSLSVVDGTLSIDGNTAATGIAFDALQTVGGNMRIDGNVSATGVSISSLTMVGGSINIDGNTSASGVDLSALATVGGSVSIDGNTAATGIDLSSLSSVTANLVVTSNAPASTVSFGNLSEVGGGTNATVDLRGGTFAFAHGLNIPTNVFLIGFGTIVGNLTNTGKIAPGTSPGRFDIAGDVVLTDNSELRIELGGYTAGSEFDFLSVTGSVALGGTLSVSLINHFERVMTNGASFALLTAGSPVTGAFANVASGGSLITPDDYVRFTVHYAGETSVRLTGVLVDTDDDGMADWWEDQFGFSKTNSADAALDLDGDGASNVNEFLAGTLPNNAASLFRIVSVEREGHDVRLTWTTVGGKSYRVTSAGDLNQQFTSPDAPIFVPGSGEGTTNFIDSGALTNSSGRYYQIRVGP